MASISQKPASLLNFRDIASINKLAHEDILGSGLVFRSSKIDTLSSEDRAILKDGLKIRTTIDLRHGSRHFHKPSSGDGFHHYVNLNGDAYSKALLKRLTWRQYIKLMTYMATNRRTDGIRVLGENVMTERGLTGLAVDTLDASTKEMCEIFALLAERKEYPVHLFCQQGKDRTGLVVVLLLLLCRVPVAVIQQDYMLSETELLPEKEERLRELGSMGLPESFAGCDPHLVSTVVEWLADKHGGVEGYLTHIGVSRDAQKAIQRNVLCQT